MCSSAPAPAPAPDTTALAASSVESARVMADLGHKQLDETKRQYDTNTAAAKPVVEAQTALMKQQQVQGDEYYARMKTVAQPVEDSLAKTAMETGTAADQEQHADRAVADVRQGQTQAMNDAIRQGLRYGFAPAQIAANASNQAASSAQAQAGAAGGARTARENLGVARKTDVAGVFRNLTGASQGAYGLVNASGNSAVGNQLAPGAQFQQGTTAGNATVGQGRQIEQQGLGQVLGAGTQYANGVNSYNAATNATSGSGLGSLIGAGASLAMKFSDRRMKENIERVGTTDLGLAIYEFDYRPEFHDRVQQGRHIGVMADEAAMLFPEAVLTDSDGYQMVDYTKIG